LLLALAAFVPLALAADDATPQVNSPLGAVAPFIGGEWHIDGKWVNGESLKARETFEWGLAKKFIEVRTYVSKSDGSGEYERYRGVFAVKDGKLVSYNFAYDGGNTVEDVTVDGKVLKIKRTVSNVDVPTVIHQEIERDGDDKFHWRVSLERDGKTDKIMDGEWLRRKEKP